MGKDHKLLPRMGISQTQLDVDWLQEHSDYVCPKCGKKFFLHKDSLYRKAGTCPICVDEAHSNLLRNYFILLVGFMVFGLVLRLFLTFYLSIGIAGILTSVIFFFLSRANKSNYDSMKKKLKKDSDNMARFDKKLF